MKIKKSDLNLINVTLEEVDGFLNGFLDFCDDEQTEYVFNLIDNVRKSEDILNNIINK